MSEDKPQANPPKPKPATPEPSMEEIIASIGRIIDEDNRTPSPARAALPGKSGILELTEALDPDGSIRKLPGAGPVGAEPASAPAAAPRSEPSPGGGPNQGTKSGPSGENILSDAASEATITALGRLDAIPRKPSAGPELPLGSGGRTLEEIVRDALRPLLREWLDDHLPGIVERLVRAEIERVAREAGLR